MFESAIASSARGSAAWASAGPSPAALAPPSEITFSVGLCDLDASGSLAEAALAGMGDEIAGLRASDDPDAAIGELAALERLGRIVDAAKLRVTEAFVSARRREQLAAGARPEQVARGVVSEVALARGMSPAKARRSCRLARDLVHELPRTMAELTAGRTTEWRASLVAKETRWLSGADRGEVDSAVAPRLRALGDRAVEGLARRHAYAVDPAGAVESLAIAEADRRVSLRPAPDVMSRFAALLPVCDGVAVLAALRGAADSAKASGDPRSRDQVMADTLVERVTGRTAADGAPVMINLVMTDSSLLDRPMAGGDEPAVVDGYGPIPAPVARRLALTGGGPKWLRRLFTRPDSGQLVTMEVRGRRFTRGQQEFIRLRDQICRTPFCDAPIRHADHVDPAAAGGPTSLDNGQGLCEACNQAKEARGFATTRHPDGTLTITTPSGRTYSSRPPDPPGSGPPPGRR